MDAASARMPAWLRHGLFAFGTMTVLIGGAAQAQNLDQGKPPARLFSDGCATCHRTPRGLYQGSLAPCGESDAVGLGMPVV